MQRAKLSNLIPDQENANTGTVRGTGVLEGSLREFGAGRSVLVDKHNRLIAGNKTVEAAASIGLDDVIIVDTDGTQLVAVRRNDLDLDTAKGRLLAYADNRVGQLNLSFSAEQIAADMGEGLDLSALWTQAEIAELLDIDIDADTEPEERLVECPHCGSRFSPRR